MCILSRQIDEIAATRIYCTELIRGAHATVYSMEIATRVPVAMILPVPVCRGLGDDALEFVDLSGNREFFNQLDSIFPQPMLSLGISSRGIGTSLKSLVVHDVGDFIASYVPGSSDFDRLDPVFRLDPAAWSTLPDYSDFGFAVFQLKPTTSRRRRIHPMAYRYPAERSDELFFPTVHVHDGRRADPDAHFDHILYFQKSDTFPWIPNWEESEQPPSVAILGDTRGLVDDGPTVFRRRLNGVLPNADHVLVRDGRVVEHRERGLVV